LNKENIKTAKIEDAVFQTFDWMAGFNKKMVDIGMMNFGIYSWFNDQTEKMTIEYLNQRKSSREEFLKSSEQMLTKYNENMVKTNDIFKQIASSMFQNQGVPFSNFFAKGSKSE
jgi:ASC-1-like (ASCH) protein